MKQRETALGRRIGERDAGLRRLRHATALALAGTAALAAAFGGLAAKAFSGHSHKRVPVVAPTAPAPLQPAAAVAPPLVAASPVGTGDPSGDPAAQQPAPATPQPAPPPPPPAPVVTQAPPVAVSGGS